MATSQDGPTSVGGIDDTTGSIRPLLIENATGNLKTTGSGGGGGGAVTIANGADVAEGATTDAAVTTDTTGTVSGKLRGLVKWAFERMPASLGQKLMAASFPVTLASDQSAIPVTLASAPTTAVTVANGADVAEGATTDAAVDTDTTGTVSGKLRGLVKLWVNYLTRFPASLGQTTMTASLPVVIASNQSAVPVTLASAPTTAVTIADGADVTQGAKADARSTATDTTAITVMSVLKQISFSMQAAATSLALFVFGPGTAAAAQRTTLASDDPAVATLGATSGAAVITDANGTIQQYLRGLIKLAITAGSFLVTVQSKTVYQRTVYGTAQTVFNSSTDIAAGAFSAAGTDFTNNDATIGACLYADAMIEMPDWAAAPVAGTVVQLWGLLINVDGTDDDTDAPSAAASGGARLLGSWVIAAADALQRRTITISLAGIASGFTPYVFNGTAQNMNNDGGTNMVVKITPWTVAQVG